MILRLGRDGSQIDLQQKSLQITPERIKDNSKKAEAADTTLHVSYLPEKRTFNLSWRVLSYADYNILVGLYDLQRTSLEPLLYTIENVTQTENYKVYMSPLPKGLQAREIGYMYNISVRLREI